MRYELTYQMPYFDETPRVYDIYAPPFLLMWEKGTWVFEANSNEEALAKVEEFCSKVVIPTYASDPTRGIRRHPVYLVQDTEIKSWK